MSTVLARAPLTALLLTTLAGAGVGVGNGVVPTASGWDGQPNAPGSAFRPYLVLVTLAASASTGPVGDPQGDWRVPYLVQSFGASQQQAEITADAARLVLAGLRGTTHTLGVPHTVLQVWSESIGAVTRVDVSDPPYWGQADQFTVWITKEP